jgi:hypothetical protein
VPANVEKRKRQAKLLMTRAGVIAAPTKGGGRLATESILVFSGKLKSDLTIFDQEGDEIGEARKSRDEYELSDAEPLCRVRRTYKSRWHNLYFEFSVLGLDGTEIGTIGRRKERDSMAIKLRRPGGGTIATIQDESGKDVIGVRSSWRRFYIYDEPGDAAARLTYLRELSFWTAKVGYVLELQPGLSEPLRTLIVATVLAVDHNIIDRSGGDGGGA